jgi:hypothetical protein
LEQQLPRTPAANTILAGALQLTKDKNKTHFKKKLLSNLFGEPHTCAASSGNISCDRYFRCLL